MTDTKKILAFPQHRARRDIRLPLYGAAVIDLQAHRGFDAFHRRFLNNVARSLAVPFDELSSPWAERPIMPWYTNPLREEALTDARDTHIRQLAAMTRAEEEGMRPDEAVKDALRRIRFMKGSRVRTKTDRFYGRVVETRVSVLSAAGRAVQATIQHYVDFEGVEMWMHDTDLEPAGPEEMFRNTADYFSGGADE